MTTIVSFPPRLHVFLTRTCVLRHSDGKAVNLNEEFGLDAYSSYTIEEYLEDQEQYERRLVVARDSPEGAVQRWSGGVLVGDGDAVECGGVGRFEVNREKRRRESR